MQGRLSHLFIVERPHLHIRSIGIQPTVAEAEKEPVRTPAKIIERLSGWMKTLKQPTIDSFVQFDDGGYSVVASGWRDAQPAVGGGGANRAIADNVLEAADRGKRTTFCWTIS